MTEFRPTKVWVFYGGNSHEREVSLKTGEGMIAALKNKGFDVEGFDVSPELLTELPIKESRPDIVLLALHGRFGEDGVIQGFLQSQNILYVGSGVMSSALCLHKGITKNVLRAAGVPVPHSYDFAGEEHFHVERRRGALPEDFYNKKWFIKPAEEGSTIGIERFDPSEFSVEEREPEFLKKFQESLKYCHDVLVEEWIEGVEVTVPVFEGRAMPSVEIRPKSKFYDYKSKYTAGETEYLCPAELGDDQLQQLAALAVQTFHILKCEDYGRVDFMVSPNHVYVLEMNTLPGMTPTSLVPKSAKANGMDYDTFVEKLVCSSYKRQKLQGSARS